MLSLKKQHREAIFNVCIRRELHRELLSLPRFNTMETQVLFEVNHKISGLESVNQLANTLNSATLNMSTVLADIQKQLQPAQIPYLPYLEKFVGFALALYSCTLVEDNYVRTIILASWAATAGVMSSIINCISILAPLFSTGLKTQTDDRDPGLFSVFYQSLLSIFGFINKEFIKLSKDFVTNFVKDVSAVRSLGDVFSFIMSHLRKALVVIGFLEPSDIEKLQFDVIQWMKKVSVVVPRDLAMEIMKEDEIKADIQDLIISGHALRARMGALPGMPIHMSHAFSASLASLDKVKNFVDAKNRRDKPRKDPVCLWFCGEPGQGKTNIIPFIFKDISIAFGRDNFDFNRDHFPVNPQKAFMDGYNGQWITLIDDIFQLATQEACSDIANFFIHIANQATMNLDMAQVELKASMFFDSDFIVMTDNQTRLPPHAKIASSGAFYRRLDYHVRVIADPSICKYAKGGETETEAGHYVIDSDKISLIENFDMRDYVRFVPALKYTDHQFTDIKQKTEIYKSAMTYDIFVNKVAETYDKRLSSKSAKDQASELTQCRINKIPKNKKIDKTQYEEIQSVLTGLRVQGDDVEDLIAEIKQTEDEFKPLLPQENEENVLDWYMKQRDAKDTLKNHINNQFKKAYTKADGATRPVLSLVANSFSTFNLYISNFFTTTVQKSKVWLSDNRVKTVLAVCSLLGIAVGLYSYLAVAPPSVDTEVGPYPSDSKPARVQTKPSNIHDLPKFKPIKLSNVYKERVATTQMHTQGNDNEENFNMMVAKNLAHVAHLNPTTFDIQNRLWCLFVKEREFIVPLHFFSKFFVGFDHMLFEGVGWIRQVPFTSITAVKAGTDMLQCTIDDPTFPLRRDISGHIAQEEDIVNADLSQTYLLKLKKETGTLEIRSTKAKVEGCQVNDGGTQYYLPSALSLPNIYTVKGDCGLPYIVRNDHMQKKIIAMHVAGDGVNGCGHFYSKMFQPQSDTETPLVGDCVTPIIQVPVNLVRGYLVPNQTPRLPTKTNIVKSPLHKDVEKVYGITKAPAHLAPSYNEETGERVSPAQNAFNKNIVEPPVLSDEDKEILKSLRDPIVSTLPCRFTPRLMEWDEVLNVPKGWIHTEPIRMEKSKGYFPEFLHDPKCRPGKWEFCYCLECSQQGLEPYPMHDPNYLPGKRHTFLLKPNVKSFLELLELQAVKNDKTIWGDLLFQDQLKDELREFEKLDTPRLFSAGNCFLLFLARRYLQSFIDNVSGDPINGPIALSIDPASPQWKLLYEKLKRFGELTRWLPGDYKKYDASQFKEICDLSCEVIKTWHRIHNPALGEEFYAVLDAIFEATYYNSHVFLNVVYNKPGANPSGQLLTTVHNCIVNLAVHMYAVIKYQREQSIDFTGWDYLSKFQFTSLGDDHVETTAEEWWDMVKKAHYISKLNMTYTSADKTGVNKLLEKEEDVTFLSRWFDTKTLPGECLAPLKIESIYNSLAFIHSKDTSPDVAMPQTIQNALKEIAMHGKDKYDNLTRFLMRSCQENTVPYPGHRTWEQQVNVILQVQSDNTKVDNYTPNAIDATKVGETDEVKVITAFSDVQPAEYAYGTHRSALAIKYNPFTETNVKEIMERQHKVAAFTWSSTQALGAQIQTFNFPEVFQAIPLIDQLRLKHRYYKADVKIDIVVNAVQQNYGNLAFCWLPFYEPTTSIYNKFVNMYQACSNNVVIASANTRERVSFIMPWVPTVPYGPCGPTSWSTPGTKNFIGHLRVFILSPLRSVQTTSTVNCEVSIYASFMNFEFMGPFDTQGSDIHENETEKATKTGTLTNVFSTAKGVTSIVSSLGIMRPQMTLANTILSKLESFSRGLGYSKPTSTEAEQRFVNHPMQNPSLGSGLDQSSKLAATADNHVSTIHSNFGTSKDYDLLVNLAGLPSLVQVFEILSSDISGTRVWTKNVMPTTHHNDLVTGIHALSHVANVASLFKYYQGPLKGVLRFCTSKFTSARVALVVTPPNTVPPVTYVTGGNLVSKIIDVTGDTFVAFTIPYMRNTAWSPITDQDDQSMCMATLSLYVINPVVTPSSDGSSNIYVQFWIAGGEALRFSRLGNPFYPPTFDAQGDTMEGYRVDLHMRELFERPFEGVIPTEIVTHDKICMGEQLTRMSECLSRFRRLRGEAMLIPGGVGSSASNNRIFRDALVDVSNCSPFIVRALHTYLFYRGSYNVKVYPFSNNNGHHFQPNLIVANIQTAYPSPYAPNEKYSDGYIVTNPNKTIPEVCIPYYANVNYCNHTNLVNANYYDYRGVHVEGWAQGTAEVSILYDLLWAAGHDFSVGWPSAPLIYQEPELPLQGGQVEEQSLVDTSVTEGMMAQNDDDEIIRGYKPLPLGLAERANSLRVDQNYTPTCNKIEIEIKDRDELEKVVQNIEELPRELIHEIHLMVQSQREPAWALRKKYIGQMIYIREKAKQMVAAGLSTTLEYTSIKSRRWLIRDAILKIKSTPNIALPMFSNSENMARDSWLLFTQGASLELGNLPKEENLYMNWWE